MGTQPGGAAAIRVWRRSAREWVHALVDAFFAEPDDQDRGTARVSTDSSMLLTKEEAQQLSTEVGEVFERWADHGRRAGSDGRRTYLGIALVQPYPEGVAQSSVAR